MTKDTLLAEAAECLEKCAGWHGPQERNHRNELARQLRAREDAGKDALDAARYRWLRDPKAWMYVARAYDDASPGRGESLDRAIDAALSTKPEAGEGEGR